MVIEDYHCYSVSTVLECRKSLQVVKIRRNPTTTPYSSRVPRQSLWGRTSVTMAAASIRPTLHQHQRNQTKEWHGKGKQLYGFVGHHLVEPTECREPRNHENNARKCLVREPNLLVGLVHSKVRMQEESPSQTKADAR